jgi:hypothetical protein
MKNYMRDLVEITLSTSIPLNLLNDTFQSKTTQYIMRDLKNSKEVDYMLPIKQYNRAINVMNEYTKRKLTDVN